MSAWVCVRDCYDEQGRLVPGWDGSPSKPRTIVYGDDHQLLASNASCFRRIEGRAQGARDVMRDCIRTSATIDGVRVSAAPLNVELMRQDPELYGRFREMVIEAMRLAPNPTDQSNTPAHLAAGAKFNSTHALAHLERLTDPDVQSDPASVSFNAKHALRHAQDADDHLDRWIEDSAEKDSKFKAEYQKVTTQAAGPLTTPPKGDQSKSDDLHDTAARRRRLRQIRQPAPARDVELVPSVSRVGVSFGRGVVDQMLATARANPQLEVGGVLFAERSSTNPIVVRAVSEPGPRSSCSPTSYLSDPGWDMEQIDLMGEWSLVEVGSFHTHWSGATDRERPRDPSLADLHAWSDARQLAEAQRYVGVILVMRSRAEGQPELIPFVLSDSLSGYADVVHRSAVV